MKKPGQKGITFRLKVPVLNVMLVVVVVLVISVPLTERMMNRERAFQANALWNSADILLGAIAAGAESQIRLDMDGFLGIQDILRLRAAMADSISTTISGPDPSLAPTGPKDFVWASDSQEFVDERARGNFRIAQEIVKDGLSEKAAGLQKQIDGEAGESLAPLIDEYRSLQGRARTLRSSTDTALKAQLRSVFNQLARQSEELDRLAKDRFARSSTLEPFNPGERLRPSYLFYKPIVYYNRAANPAETTFYQGMVRLPVSSEATNRRIDESMLFILKTASTATLAAIATGVLGCILIASISIGPARRATKMQPKQRGSQQERSP